MRVLILGAGGQLGRVVAEQAPLHAKVSAYTSAVCDITDAQQVQRVLHKTGADLIINCAAYTNVDLAESEKEQAFAANATGVRNLIEHSGAAVRILHVSTDFVFDGSATVPYSPQARTGPLSVYGASKLAGEELLRELAPTRSTIVRTAWLYAAEGRNFFTTMLGLMQSRDELRVVSDQRGTPTAAHGLAAALWRFADRPHLHGTYHWTDQGEASWYEFASEIQQQARQRGLLNRTIPLHAIATREWPTPAQRPAYSVLDKQQTEDDLQLSLRPWQVMLGEVLDLYAALQQVPSPTDLPATNSHEKLP